MSGTPGRDRDAAVRELASVVAEATRADGVPPFSDQALVEARSGASRLLLTGDAAAIVRSDHGEAELVVRPEARRHGAGTALLAEILDTTTGPLAVWAHGDHPGARRLAERFGFEGTRVLLQQRATVATDPGARPLPRGTVVRPYRPGVDDAAWLELNARAFAGHPEQGSLGQADLDARRDEPWFDADDFLLLWQDDALVAYCWLKVEADQPAEFYAVGVAPEHQGEHLGGAAVDAGLRRVAERGLREVSLYVEGDNAAALRLYAARGFVDHTVDVQYTLAHR